MQTVKAWPIAPLVCRSFKVEVSEKLPQGLLIAERRCVLRPTLPALSNLGITGLDQLKRS